MTRTAGAFLLSVPASCRILLVSGSLRAQSTNTAVLRTAQAAAPAGVVTTLYDGLGTLPHFNPDDDVSPLAAPVAELRDEIRRADAVIVSTPEYAGALPGSLKNLLDWSIGDDDVRSIYEKPVAWINASPRGAEHAHASLRRVLGYAHADIVEAACVDVPVTGADIADGLITDSVIRDRLADALALLAAHVAARSAPAAG